MVPSVPLQTQYAVLMTAAGAVAIALGFRVFLPQVGLRDLIREFVRTDWKFLGVAWSVTMVVNQLAKFHVDTPFTGVIYAIEGSTVTLFQVVTAVPLTVYFAVVYLVGFPFVVLFTYYKLKADTDEEAYRYAIGYATLVLLATPFFLLFPVPVTSATLSDVEPLLYDLHPIVFAGTLATDTLMKSFPSLHTGLSLLAFLYARKTGDPRYVYLVGFLAGSIVVSTLYLGIHWITDAIFAAVLVGIAYRISQRVSVPDVDASVRKAVRARL